MDACTIVTRRELARARVLVASFHAQHPQAGFVVLVLDGVEGADAVEGARVITLEQIAGSAGGMLAAGNPPEALDAAVLPRLLRWLHEGQPSTSPVQPACLIYFNFSQPV